MGKTEASPPQVQGSEHYLPWHAHLTALTVAPHARRLGLARILSMSLEKAADQYDAYFVDLFVRASNKVAQNLYKGLGYSVFRVVDGYYNETVGAPDQDGGEDAYDMRKPCRKDVERKHTRADGLKHHVTPYDVW